MSVVEGWADGFGVRGSGGRCWYDVGGLRVVEILKIVLLGLLVFFCWGCCWQWCVGVDVVFLLFWLCLKCCF